MTLRVYKATTARAPLALQTLSRSYWFHTVAYFVPPIVRHYDVLVFLMLACGVFGKGCGGAGVGEQRENNHATNAYPATSIVTS